MNNFINLSKNNPWLIAIRPKTLPAASTPVIVGCALAFADGHLRIVPALACLISAILLQVGSNLANDVFDFERGADSGERLGPTRVTQSGLLSPGDVKRGMLLIFGLTALIGIYLIIEGGLPILIIGVTAIISAVAYTGGPYPLAYHGFGDLFVFIYFGLAATIGTYYIQVGLVSTTVMLMATAVGFQTVNILVVNNLRDIDGDRKVKKMTLAVRLGKTGSLLEYYMLLIGAYLIPIFIWLNDSACWGGLLTWISFPFALRWARYIAMNHGKSLNRALAGTGQVEMLYSILFAVGMVAEVVIT